MNCYEGVTQALKNRMEDCKTMQLERLHAMKERAKESRERAKEVQKLLKAENSRRLEQFAHDDKKRTSEIKELFTEVGNLCGETGKMINGLHKESVERARDFRGFLATGRALRGLPPSRFAKRQPVKESGNGGKHAAGKRK